MSALLHSQHKPFIMGVLNVTPDSFYDGGHFHSLENALKRAEQMVAEGVDIIDIGGESARPGALATTIDEELQRVIPVIEVLRKELVVPLSIDTRHTRVMKYAIESGATMINDVMALQDEGAVAYAASVQASVCLMHMQGLPHSMQANPQYKDVMDEVYQFLQHRIEICEASGIAKDNIYIDPGFGFGKTLNHNLMMLGQLSQFKKLGCKILVGLSRKSMFGKILNVEAEDRLFGSLGAAMLALLQGADIIRTHDVRATKDILEVYQAVKPFWHAPETLQNQGSEQEYA
ncbi:MAG: dihydropteroate synthase [Candidatus Berkiella sp.]